jgi:hypothetical protein
MSVKTSQEILRGYHWKQASKDSQSSGEWEVPPFPAEPESDYGAANQGGDRPKGDAKAPDQDDDQEPRKFPLWCLPPVLRDMAKAISDSVRVPLELAGPIVLGIISGAIGKGLRLKSGADRMVRGNLYLFGIAESGTGKSSACELAAEPIQAAEKDALGFWKEMSKPEVKAEIRILDREIKALENQLSGKKNCVIDRSKIKKELSEKIARMEYWQEKLDTPRMIVEDVTQEALGSLLARNSEQLFSLSADAGKTLQNLEGRYIKEKGKSDDDIYVKSYTGDRCLVDRIGRDPVILENPCLALLWLIQPERAQRLLANQDLRDGGFLPRCLIWDSQAEPTEEPEQDHPIGVEVQVAFDTLVKQLLSIYHDGKGYTIPPSKVAKEAIRKYYNRLVTRRRRNLRDINSFVARWHEQAWRILVVVHAAAYGEKAHLTEIEDSFPVAAIEIAEWFGAEQVRLLSAARNSADRDSLDRLLELVTRDYKSKVTLRDLERRHCYRRQELERLALKFPSKIAIRGEEPGPNGGRPSEVLVVLSPK